MQVKLLAYTQPCLDIDGFIPSTEVFCASCAKGCYSEDTSAEIMEKLVHHEEKARSTLDHIVSSGHGSVVEHVSFTFSISGISRACSHQIVRHRMASYSQQSQRYVDIDDTWESIVIPPTIQEVMDDEDALADTRSDEHMLNAIEEYKHALKGLLSELDAHGIPSEDRRYFVPQGTMTSLTVTMNARSLLNFFKWRCCSQAQWEIRAVANAMLDQCRAVCPTIFKDAGPECRRTGCREGKRSCKAIVPQ